jgi:DNA-binding MarR family transcriptional regulator
MTPGELAAHERVRPPSMTRTVASLVDTGLCSRTPDPTDGRQVIVGLTDRAVDLLRADRARRRAWLATRLADLSPQERAALAAAAPILDRLAGS